MVWTMCILLLGAVLLFCGWAICRAAGAITEQEIQPPDSEPRIVPINRTPWKDPPRTIVINAEQQAELMRIYRQEYREQSISPEMPLRVFLCEVMSRQRSGPIEIELLFAQQKPLRDFGDKHQLGWLQYAIDRAMERKEQLT